MVLLTIRYLSFRRFLKYVDLIRLKIQTDMMKTNVVKAFIQNRSGLFIICYFQKEKDE